MATPVEPLDEPMKPSELLTTPPANTFSVPSLELPTNNISSIARLPPAVVNMPPPSMVAKPLISKCCSVTKVVVPALVLNVVPLANEKLFASMVKI